MRGWMKCGWEEEREKRREEKRERRRNQHHLYNQFSSQKLNKNDIKL
jgi:hypothetical protein